MTITAMIITAVDVFIAMNEGEMTAELSTANMMNVWHFKHSCKYEFDRLTHPVT
jgi:hypothetical protein